MGRDPSTTVIAPGYRQQVHQAGCRFTALHCAATYGNFDVVAYLIRARADGNQTDNDGRTPLDCARLFAKDEAGYLLAKVRLATSASPLIAVDDMQRGIQRKASNMPHKALVHTAGRGGDVCTVGPRSCHRTIQGTGLSEHTPCSPQRTAPTRTSAFSRVLLTAVTARTQQAVCSSGLHATYWYAGAVLPATWQMFRRQCVPFHSADRRTI